MKARSHLSSIMTHYITLYKINKSLMQSAADLFNAVRFASYSAYFIRSCKPMQAKIISLTEYTRIT
jgi:hypothetical protein